MRASHLSCSLDFSPPSHHPKPSISFPWAPDCVLLDLTSPFIPSQRLLGICTCPAPNTASCPEQTATDYVLMTLLVRWGLASTGSTAEQVGAQAWGQTHLSRTLAV